ncbi:MAG: histidine phosphatase family protein [Methylobacteriaceae bacterium]|nr:histidine phosphatase family protein [Methylobacteriaceae bacterium]
MKRVVFLRHAKAVAKDAADDFNRALAPRGHEQMKVVAPWLASRPERIERALVSPSVRTRETWTRAELPDVPVTLDPKIYEATARNVLEVLRSAPDQEGTVALVGHNPGLEEASNKLVGSGPAGLRAKMESKFPTGAVAIVEFDVASWRDVSFGSGQLAAFVTPAALGSEDD